jgi:hypothetical protein
VSLDAEERKLLSAVFQRGGVEGVVAAAVEDDALIRWADIEEAQYRAVLTAHPVG